MNFAITNRFTGAVQFTAEIEADDNTPRSIKISLAVRWAIKTRANLTDANLAGADLADAYLAGAYLADAYLARANLTDAYLARANLTDANLTDANLARANLAGAKWRDGIVISKQPIQIYGLRYTVTILDAHMQIGCELHRLCDWESFDDARINEMDGRDALRFWLAHEDGLLSVARGADRDFTAEPVEATS